MMIVKLKDTTIVQEFDNVICKCQVHAMDKRSGEKEHLTIFVELTEQEQEPKVIVEKILRKLGYYFYSFDIDPETTTIPFDAEKLFELGKAKEIEDLHRP